MAPRVSLAALGLLVALSGAVAAAPWAGKGAAAKSPPPPVAKPVPAAPAKIEVAADKPPTVAAPHNVYWYNEVTGATSTTDPLKDFHGHVNPEGHTYWVDPDTGASVWEAPEPYAWTATESVDHPGRFFYYNKATKESTWERPAIMAWKTAEKGFWHNNVTGESAWDPPAALGVGSKDGSRYWVVDGEPTWTPPAPFAWRAVPSTKPDDAGRPYFENWVTKEVTWERPAALGWSRRSVNDTWWWNIVTGETVRVPPPAVVGIPTEDGQNHYFVDPKTGEATWEKPAAASWHEAKSEKHDGRPYWFNTVTKETVWERPADSNVAWQKQHSEL